MSVTREPKAKPRRLAVWRSDAIECAALILTQAERYGREDALTRWARGIMAGRVALADQWRLTA